VGGGGVWEQVGGTGRVDGPQKGVVVSVVRLFLRLSFDSFAVLTPLFAESAPSYRLAGLIGAVTAASLLTAVAAWGAPKAQSFAPRLARLDRIAPYIMIAVGLYILSNTGTDTL